MGSSQVLVDPVATLRANLDALPLAARKAVESEHPERVIRVDPATAPTSFSVRTRDGRSVRLHSGRDPVTEAERFVDDVLPGAAPPVVTVVGAGLGYVVEAIGRRAPRARILAIEPFADIARAMLGRRDWRDWFDGGRLTLLVGPDYPGAADAWQLLDPQAGAPPIIEHPVLGREFPRDMARARIVASHIALGAEANAVARQRFAGRYLLNTLANLPALAREGDVSALGDLFGDLPAIVVAAGPSLDDAIPHLQALGGRALIVAVDTTLRPLRAAGIRPHVVVAVDPSERNAGHLVGVADTAGSWLVSEGSVHPTVFPAFAGRAFGFKVSRHHPWPWLRSLGIERGTLRAWGSVLTTAFDLACHMGCDPIVFVGADLAYTGGLHYCRGTMNEDPASHAAPTAIRAEGFAEAARVNRQRTCQQIDLRGEPVLSTPDFVQFRNWLVARAAAVAPRRVLNATGWGILHGDGMTQTDLAAVPFPNRPAGDRDIRGRLSAAWQRSADVSGAAQRTLERDIARQGTFDIPVDGWTAFAGSADTAADAARLVATAWRTAPIVTTHPASQRRMPGWTARFTAAATGGPAPTVQWQSSTDGGSSWSDVPGATAATHAFTLTAADAGTQVRAVFHNAWGSATTDAAVASIAARGVPNDFDGDGKPDILWRHAPNGSCVAWFMDGATRTGLAWLDTREADMTWAIAGIADFNGDGRPDILWRHTSSGANRIWHLDGATLTGVTEIESEGDLAWTIAGTGDFSGTGRPDILWRHNASGAVRVWLMDEVTRTGVSALDAEPDLTWTIAGTGDFTGDGAPDILWRNVVSGAVRVWVMDGVTRTRVVALDAEPDLAWSIVGTVDTLSVGAPDILWHNTVTGANRLWHVRGLMRTGVDDVETLPELAWKTCPERRDIGGSGLA